MMSLEEVLKDVNTRKANLTKLGKAITGDKDKAKIAKQLDDVGSQLKKLVDDKKDLEKRIKDAGSLKDDVKDYADSLKAIKLVADKLGTQCQNFRGKDDTVNKDFSGILNDMNTITSTSPITL